MHCLLLLSLQANHQQLRLYCSTQFQVINRNMSRYYAAPARPIGRRTRTPLQPRQRFTGVGVPRIPGTLYGAPAQPTGAGAATTGNRAHQPPPPPNGGAPPAQPQGQQQQPPVDPQDYAPYDNPQVDPDAKLGRAKTLLDLWHEWCHGLQGNKAARLFTPVEKGQKKVKFKFSRRNNFWIVMRHLTLGKGHSELSAIDLIEQCYGRNLPVTSMLKKLCEAKEKGYHPNLDMNMPTLNNRGARMRDRRVLVDV